MADTSIEWADRVWNPVRGCAIVSPGCVRCYAMKQAHRFSGKGQPYEGLTKMTKAGPQWTGKARAVPEMLALPVRWKKPSRIFVNSMSDLFHEDVPDAFIKEAFTVMAIAKRHVFQVLTKRPKRMRDLVSSWRADDMYDFWYAFDDGAREVEAWPLPNVHLGVSCENQQTADERIPLLLQTPAAVRWVSAEPLLGPVTLNPWLLSEHGRRHIGVQPGLSWVVVGGESTREREAREQREIDAAIVAKREAIAEARRQAEAQAHRPVPFRQRRMG